MQECGEDTHIISLGDLDQMTNRKTASTFQHSLVSKQNLLDQNAALCKAHRTDPIKPDRSVSAQEVHAHQLV